MTPERDAAIRAEISGDVEVLEPARECTCGHPESEHILRRPERACGACTQCYSLNAHLPHPWHRCRCDQFEERSQP